MSTKKRKTGGTCTSAGFDKATLAFRPDSYWEYEDPLQAILANISGQARRKMITDFWNAGAADKLQKELLRDELTEETRVSLGKIDPFFLGGEYLPERLTDESTVVRINLESTTFDVIELRARRISGGKISLRWVDEYDTEFTQPFNTIVRPFNFRELIEFIEASGPDNCSWGCFPLAYNEMNNSCLGEPETLRDFTSFSSDFYPNLSSWCDRVVDEWVARETKG